MQQQTFKNYEIFGEPTTTIPKKGRNCEWKSNGKMIDRSGHTFYFPIRFETDDTIQQGYTFKLIKYVDKKEHYDEKGNLNTTLYYYNVLCVETGLPTLAFEVNSLIKAMNNVDNKNNINTIIKLAYGSTKRVGNGEKATDKPYEELFTFGAYKQQFYEFYDKYTDLGYYIHMIYGVHKYDKFNQHSTMCYGGVTCIHTQFDIRDKKQVPKRLKQEVGNCNESAYPIFEECNKSDCKRYDIKMSPCVLCALEFAEREKYDEIRKIYEEIEVQANRLTDCDNKNGEYTKKYTKQHQIQSRLEKLLTLELSPYYKTPILLLIHNWKKMNVVIKSRYMMDEVENERFDTLIDVFTELQSPTPKDYARLILSLCSQFDLDYDRILEYYVEMLEFVEDNVTTIYTKQHKKDDTLYEERRQQRLKEEEESKKLKRVDDLIQWDENEDLTNNDMEFLRFTNKRFK